MIFEVHVKCVRSIVKKPRRERERWKEIAGRQGGQAKKQRCRNLGRDKKRAGCFLGYPQFSFIPWNGPDRLNIVGKRMAPTESKTIRKSVDRASDTTTASKRTVFLPFFFALDMRFLSALSKFKLGTILYCHLCVYRYVLLFIR